MTKSTPYTLLLFIFLFKGGIFSLFAQTTDSVKFVSQTWNTKKIKKGIIWKQAHFEDLFHLTQEVNIVEIDLKRHSKKIRLAGISDNLKLTSQFAKDNEATIALNGGFFDMKNGGAIDLIKINNEVINYTKDPYTKANALFIFSDTKNIITDVIDSTSYYSTFPNIMRSGPLLIQNKNTLTLESNPFNDNRHPRSAIALKNNKLILITIDGRNSKAHGMSLHELAKILYWYQVQDAMNLDGGGSTTLYIKNQTPNGVVNYPSDNKLFDHLGERPVANVILIL